MKYLKKSIHLIERGIDGVRDHVWKLKVGSENCKIMIYHGYQVENYLCCSGRLIKEKEIKEAQESDDFVTNAVRMFQLLNTREIKFQNVTLKVGTEQFDQVTDEEGYFNFKVELEDSSEANDLWRKVELSVKFNDGEAVEQGWVQLKQPTAQFGVISDIDDTIMQSDVPNIVQLIKNTFGKNAKTRLAFPGVTELYQAFVNGQSDRPTNPIFYLSNGPWNFFEFLNHFMEINEIPRGTFMLRDYGIDHHKFLKDDQHKVESIRTILNDFQDLPFILIGDSGEHDAQYYQSIVEGFKGRIKAVYIRDVTDDEKDKIVRDIASEVTHSGVPMYLVSNSFEIAEHAAGKGWIKT